jgi:hypothetical protein
LPKKRAPPDEFRPAKQTESIVNETVQKIFQKLLTPVWRFAIVAVHTVTLNKNTH